MIAKRTRGIYFLLLAGLSVSAGELYRGSLNSKGNDDSPAISVTFILEQDEGFENGWLAIGDNRQARVYGKSGIALNLLWADGSKTILTLEREEDSYVGTWTEKDSELNVRQFVVRMENNPVKEISDRIEQDFFTGILPLIEQLASPEKGTECLDLFTSLALAFPTEHVYAGGVATIANFLVKKEASANWYREAAKRAYNSGDNKALADYHYALTSLLQGYPEEIKRKYKSIYALPPAKEPQLES